MRGAWSWAFQFFSQPATTEFEVTGNKDWKRQEGGREGGWPGSSPGRRRLPSRQEASRHFLGLSAPWPSLPRGEEGRGAACPRGLGQSETVPNRGQSVIPGQPFPSSLPSFSCTEGGRLQA